MYNEFNTFFGAQSASRFYRELERSCVMCGRQIMSEYTKATCYVLLGVGVAYCAGHLVEVIKQKEAQAPEPESMHKVARALIATNTSTQVGTTVFYGPSGDLTVYPVISKKPPYTQEADGIEFSTEPQSVFDAMVHKNGTDPSKPPQRLTPIIF